MNTAWQLWSHDLFDREAPRWLEQRGAGLQAGLQALWQAHLSETIQPDGQSGFTRFNLWLTDERRSITIAGSPQGQQRLRQWLLSPGGGQPLLEQLATAHAALLARGQDGAAIAEAAAAATVVQEFKARLQGLAGTGAAQ